MITHNETTTTIQCDKCKRESIAPTKSYNEWFYDEGWALNKGRKYKHLCRQCLPKKSRDAMDFVKEKFGR
jgi:hypothetical protein